MGANILTKYCGEEGEKTPLSGAISVSNPLDLVKGSAHLDTVHRYTYSRIFGARTISYAKR